MARRTGPAQPRPAAATALRLAVLALSSAGFACATSTPGAQVQQAPTNVVLDWVNQVGGAWARSGTPVPARSLLRAVIARGILATDLSNLYSASSADKQSATYLEVPLQPQQAARTLALVTVSMLETLNLFGGAVTANVSAGLVSRAQVPSGYFAAADLAAALPAAAASFAAHWVLSSLYPSRAQNAPPFLDGVLALHLAQPQFGLSLALPQNQTAVAAAQRVGTFVARVILASKQHDNFAYYKSYSFNQTLAATCVPPLSQYRATGSSSAPLSTNIVAATGPYPASFFAASGPLVAPVANAGAGGFAPNPTAFLFPQLQLATPVATAQGKDFKPSKTTGVAGVVDPGQTDPFWAPYPVTGYLLPGTYGPSDAAALLGSFYNVSGSANSTSGWFGYNFTTAAYPDPLYNASLLRAQYGSVPGVKPNPYYADLNQVRWLGQKNSVFRSPDQTNLAYFWRLGGGTATPAGFINKLATQLLVGNATTAAALDTPSGLYASAALLARLNVANWDAGISAWYWKYKNAFWRPESALRYGDNSTLGLFATQNAAGYTNPGSTPPATPISPSTWPSYNGAGGANWPSESTPVYATPAAQPGAGAAFTPLFNATGAVATTVPSGSSWKNIPATPLSGAPGQQLHAAWTSELAAPGSPEYPAEHSVTCEVAAQVLRQFFGTDSIEAVMGGAPLTLHSEDTYLGAGTGPGAGQYNAPWNAVPDTPVWALASLYYFNVSLNASSPSPVAAAAYSLPYGLAPVAYHTLSQVSRDCSNARVWGGVHLNSSTNDGIALGSGVAQFVYASYPGNLTAAVAAALQLFGPPAPRTAYAAPVSVNESATLNGGSAAWSYLSAYLLGSAR